MLPDGTLTVADAYRCRILFIRNHRIVRQIGQTDVCAHDPPRTLGYVNGDTPLPDGGVLVSEINGSWIDKFSPTGRLIRAFQAPVSYPSDPQLLSRGRILLADYASPGAVVILDQHGRVLWRYGPASGWGALNHPSLAIMLPNGDIAVNDDYNDRVVIIDPKRRQIVLAIRAPRAAGPRRAISFARRTGWTTSRSARTRSRSGSSCTTRSARTYVRLDSGDGASPGAVR